MKKQTLIVIILCLLVAAVITLSVTGVIGPQEGSPGSFAGQTDRELLAPNSIAPLDADPEYTFPSCPE